MELRDFVSVENMSKENPFEGCNVVKKIGVREYTDIVNSAMRIAFNLETNTPRILFYDFAVKFSIMSYSLGLEMNDYDIDEVFSAIMTSDIYEKFLDYMSSNGINMLEIEIAVYKYIDNELENYRIKQTTDERIMNTVMKLFENEAFQNLIENSIAQEEAEVDG